MYKIIKKNLYIEKVNITKEFLNKYNRTLNLYSEKKIIKNLKIFKKKNFKFFYAVKANNNGRILSIIKNYMNFEAVSYGEIKKIIEINVSPNNIIFSGVGKSVLEIKKSINRNVKKFNVESVQELKRIYKICKEIKKTVYIILRINLNIDCKTHKGLSTGVKESKFGICIGDIKKTFRFLGENLKLLGLGFHLGSQIKKHKYYERAIIKLREIEKNYFYRFKLKIINLGGGICINYKKKNQETKILMEKIKKTANKIFKNKIFYFEPGRSLIGDTCLTLFRVEYVKRKYIITDLGMNNIIRPALYKSYHKILNLKKRKRSEKKYDIVGPICECSDILSKNIRIKVKQGDFLIMLNTGAYCYSMRSNYNSRQKSHEFLIRRKNFEKI